jgi:hypothetical protein
MGDDINSTIVTPNIDTEGLAFLIKSHIPNNAD